MTSPFNPNPSDTSGGADAASQAPRDKAAQERNEQKGGATNTPDARPGKAPREDTTKR